MRLTQSTKTWVLDSWKVFMKLVYVTSLKKEGWLIKRQVIILLVYDGIKFAEGFGLDILVEGRIICELKSVERMENVHLSQVPTYLKLTRNRLGFLINFNVSLFRTEFGA